MSANFTKIKSSAAFRLACLAASLVFFFLSALSAVNFFLGCSVLSTDVFLQGNKTEFTDSKIFGDIFSAAVANANTVAESNTEQFEKLIDSESQKAAYAYAMQKANIIKNELEYAVADYASSDEAAGEYSAYESEFMEEYYDLFNESTSNEFLTDFYSEQTQESANIQAARFVLENYSDEELLEYSYLVREAAFDVSFSYEVTPASGIYVNLFLPDLTYDKQSAQQQFASQIRTELEYAGENQETNTNESLSFLGSVSNVCYYIETSDGRVYSNLNDIPSDDELGLIYAKKSGGEAVCSGFPGAEDATASLKASPDGELTVFLGEELLQEDALSYAAELVKRCNSHDAVSLIIAAVVYIIIAAVLVCLFLSGTAAKASADGKTAFIDRLPLDLHAFACVCVSFFGVLAVAVYSASFSTSVYSVFLARGFDRLIVAAAVICFMLLIELLASAFRLSGVGKRLFSCCMLGKLGIMIKKSLLRSAKKLKAVFSYKPKMLKHIIWLGVLYFVFNLIYAIMLMLVINIFPSIIPVILLTLTVLTVDAATLIFFFRYFSQLDKIIAATSVNNLPALYSVDSPASLALLARNFAKNSEVLKLAVAKAVKDEQLKTELITNVSHDLKTPLTSLITYTDLLEKCDITDENAKKYVKVLNAQSQKLRRLIDDLIEASKVNSGNVTLNKVILSLSELAVQTIDDFAREMEANGNEIILSCSAEPTRVVADSAKTYRIISNLLSNAKKYSARGTRVYVGVYAKGDAGCFEIKNISSEQLNIPAEELTERFVRGDKSRSREGNGLGLSIAQNLCRLQGGDLKITIDGDLFKATVSLPLYKGDPSSISQNNQNGEDNTAFSTPPNHSSLSAISQNIQNGEDNTAFSSPQNHSNLSAISQNSQS